MMTFSRSSRLAILATTLALALTACGGDDGTAAGLPTADDPGAGDEQPAAPDDAGSDADTPATAGMCAPDHPDCQDTIVTGDAGSDADGTTGTADEACLAGDPDCTDESHDGQDVARPVPLSAAPSGAEPAERGATSGATGHRIEHAHLLDEDTLELTVGDTPCMLVEDVLVQESPDEVRVLVLAGQDASVDACVESYVQFALTVDLEAPLGERTLLDLAG